MTRRFPIAWLVATIGLGAVPALAKKKPLPKTPLCSVGRFLVAGARLVGADTVPSDAIVLANGEVGTDSGCAPAKARTKRVKKFTEVRAVWPSCGSARRATLRARIDLATCSHIKGLFKAKKTRPRRFTATLQGPPAFTAGGFTPVSLTQATVGPEGGTIAADPAGPLAGLVIVVPAGATPEPITFDIQYAEVTGATGLPAGVNTASLMIRVTATGSRRGTSTASSRAPCG